MHLRDIKWNEDEGSAVSGLAAKNNLEKFCGEVSVPKYPANRGRREKDQPESAVYKTGCLTIELLQKKLNKL